MKTKFLSVFLLGSFLAASSVTFVSCKDYDDDIDDLQTQITANKQQIDNILAAINANKFISSYQAVTGGYLLTFTDGSTLTITNGKDGVDGKDGKDGVNGKDGVDGKDGANGKDGVDGKDGANGKDGVNGKDGADGAQGLQGLQGPQGETGASIVPIFRVDADGYWQVSLDEGETFDYVLSVDGEKVKSKGEDGVVNNNVFIDDEGYINIGTERTAFKYDTAIPSIICNQKDGILEITIDGQKYTLLLEGSAYKGLQAVTYRQQYQNDEDDQVLAYTLKYTDATTKKDVTFASLPGQATFKVWPQSYSTDDAAYSFSDSYKAKTRADVEGPLFTAGSASLKDGILTVNVIPAAALEDGTYMTSLDVTLYEQYTTASNYFAVKKAEATVDVLKAKHTAVDKNGKPYDVDKDNFVYNKTYNLNDSVAAYVYDETNKYYPELGTLDIDYTQTFAFTEKAENGIFELKDGILSVKEENQSSAIGEWAHITITTTVKSQVEGVADYVFTDDVDIQAVREAAPAPTSECKTIALKPLSSLALSYSESKTQVVAFDIRSFQDALGGRDKLMNIISGNLNDNVTTLKLAKLTYNDKNEVTRSTDLTEGSVPTDTKNIASKASADKDEVYLIYKQTASETTSNTEKDSLFLVVGKGTKLDATLLYINNVNTACPNDEEPLFTSGIHVTLGSELSVTRNFSAIIKDEYKSQTIIGVWSSDKKSYELQSIAFSDMYTVSPTDATLNFVVDKDKQNDYVKAAIKDGQITFDNNVIKFSPRLDTDKIKEVKVDLYDGDVEYKEVTLADGPTETVVDQDKSNFYRTDTWAVRSPLQAWSGAANLGKVYDPTLAENSTVDVAKLAKTAWAKLVLKDYIGQTVVSMETTTAADGKTKTLTGKLVQDTDMYVQNAKSTGLEFKVNSDDWEISEDGATLKFIGKPSGSVYDKVLTITVTYTHDYGVSTFTSTVEVIGDVEK